MPQSKPELTQFDIVILGGGPAGCATALSLRSLGVERVLVVEASRYKDVRIGESVPPDIRQLLQQLGVWDAFLQEGHEPCLGSCSAWGDDALGYNDFLFNPYGHGWHLDRRCFDAFLARMAKENGVELWPGTIYETVARLDQTSFQLHFITDSDERRSVRAHFVVDATGARAVFARRMGARRLFHDRLICVSGFFNLSDDAEFPKLTMLEATEYGWWYAAKLPGRRVVTAVASDPEIIKQAAFSQPDNWLAHLQETKHTSAALTRCQFVEDSIIVRPAPSCRLDKLSGNGWLAVGDAAVAYDPITSQGIYKAVADGIEAAKRIAACLDGNLNGFDAYQSVLKARFDDYLNNRNYLYQLEKRWPSSPFWQRRQERMALRDHPL